MRTSRVPTADVAVLFIDMLGVSRLVDQEVLRPGIRHKVAADEAFANFEALFNEGGEASQRHYAYQLSKDLVSPTHLIRFSDCAFLMFDHVYDGALYAIEMMRRAFEFYLPVRMGLAVGTFHPQRFIFDVAGTLTRTESIFWGTGIVRAHESESKGGKGCRIFVHSSVVMSTLERDGHVLATLETGVNLAPLELNVLRGVLPRHIEGRKLDDDLDLVRGLHQMTMRLDKPVLKEVAVHYFQTWAAINRMRLALARPAFEDEDGDFDSLYSTSSSEG